MLFNCIILVFCLSSNIQGSNVENYYSTNKKEWKHSFFYDPTITNSSSRLITPVSKEELFIQEIYRYISIQNKDNIVPTSIVISQTILESGFGSSHAYRKKNNPLGIKYQVKGVQKSRRFRNLEESFEYYFLIIEKFDCYDGIVKKTKRGLTVFEILNDKGFIIYSGNENDYTQKLAQIIKRYDLTRFDSI